MKKIHTLFVYIGLALLLSAGLAGCAPQAAAVPAESVPATEAAPAATEIPAPKPGGTLVFAGYPEPATLDPMQIQASVVVQYLGASLVTFDPERNIVPYLAESWSVSDDGLTWTFKLRQDVKFTDGSPLTAQDYAWTFTTELNPDTASPFIPFMLGDVASVEALDDYTLAFHYNAPNAFLLFNLTESGYTQPVPRAAYESMGEDFARNPVSVGPFKLREWVTGDHITFERNPDFNWAPAFKHQGPPYLDAVEFRFIPEYATILAGLEAGEILATDKIQPQDIQRLADLGEFEVFSTTHFGMWPGIFMNASLPPFDNLKLRQALAYALDRESIRDIVYSGFGDIISGPLNNGTYGYTPEIEQYGYTFDLEKAAQLMQEAGYARDASGAWAKDGVPLQFTVPVPTIDDAFRKMGEVVQSQWKDFGVNCEIEMMENGLIEAGYANGEMPITFQIWDWADGGSLLRITFHSQVMNITHSGDPELDRLLDVIGSTRDQAAYLEATNAASRYIMENVYVITTVAQPSFNVVSSQLGGVIQNPVWHDLYLTELYFK